MPTLAATITLYNTDFVTLSTENYVVNGVKNLTEEQDETRTKL